MKIAYLLNHLDTHGGIEKIVSQKINAWIEIYGYEVVLIVKKREFENFIYNVHQDCKIYNLQIDTSSMHGYLKNLKNYFSLYNQLNTILNQEKIDIVFTTLTSIDSLIIPFLARTIPKVLELHHSGIYLPKRSWKFKKYIIEKYDVVVVLNKDEEKYYGLSNLSVIPNFVDQQSSATAVPKKNIVISAGRIDPIKQFDHMIDIWSMLANDHKNWQFHIYGNGSSTEKLKLQLLIEEKGLNQSFKIFPATNQLPEKLREASIFVQTSESECFPMVILEAMNESTPIISYDSPNGPRNIITDSYDGVLIPLNDVVKFSKKLSELIGNEQERNRLVKNQAAAIKQFSKKRVIEHWNKLASNLIK